MRVQTLIISVALANNVRRDVVVYHDILIRCFLYGIEYFETLKKITKRNTTNGCFVSSSEMTHVQSVDDSDKYHSKQDFYLIRFESSGLVVPINIPASDDIAAKYRSLHYG
ncbi:hypothetical protein ALC60_01636 [Trachymyrmex zeteki]|uniref:Uncharacterized protein n=1 Tax=Mycetomoellerius zeteki TaxID=64791 RepID=A0A151XG30_9HYME|nr:hypothetical protein ALC60_01636 [Trachymyrmex zeteki]